MASYRYLRDIDPEDTAPDAPRQYTRKEKAANWWHYHWHLVAAAVAAALLLGFFVRDIFSNGPAADYTVAIVTPGGAPESLCAGLAEALTPYADDRNGDGTVKVNVVAYAAAFGEEESESESMAASSSAAAQGGAAADAGAMMNAYGSMAGTIQLSGDFETNLSYIFLVSDPAGFERYTGGLALWDGSVPDEAAEESADGWQTMAARWADCPALTSLDLGEYASETGLVVGDSQSYLAQLYVGRRCIQSKESEKSFAGCDTFWQALTAGASPVAGAK